MSKLFDHLPALCNVIRRLAVEAGDITLEYFQEGAFFAHDIKADGSPVSIADKRAGAFITKGLREDFPNVPVVEEEAMAAGDVPDLSGQDYFWLVDPLDGTKEFIAGSPEYTVNIALIKNYKPILGVVVAPALGKIYSAYGEGTASRINIESGAEKIITVRKPPKAGLTVVGSKNRGFTETEDYLAEHKVEKILRVGSSLKLCMIAEGKADLALCFGPTSGWDTAAAQAILESAGGALTDMQRVPFTYGDKGHFNNPDFMARSLYLD